MVSRMELKITCKSAKDQALRGQIQAFADDNGLSLAAGMRFLLKLGLGTTNARKQVKAVKTAREVQK